MKCQKCGKNEVNFHLSSNVNGCVTDTYLCSKCAAESGYNLGQIFDAGDLLDSLIQLLGMQDANPGSFMPMPMPMQMQMPTPIQPIPPIPLIPPIPGFTPAYPMPAIPFTAGQPFPGARLFIIRHPAEYPFDENRAAPPPAPPADVDAEMQKRREINAIREQMRQAAENEDYEKAAQLRDIIKQMESITTQPLPDNTNHP